MLHFFNPSAIYNRVKGVADLCVGDLHEETPEPKTEHQILMTCFLEFLFNPQKKQKGRIRSGKEVWGTVGFFCASLGEVDTKNMLFHCTGHMDAIH